MNRFHVHLNVVDLASSIRFYSTLFAIEPTVVKPDYAKWMLEDPRVNFAISNTGRPAGIDHLGIQVDSNEHLAQLGQRLVAAGSSAVPEDATTCCYAQSDKMWTADPQGTRWETFRTFGDAVTYFAADRACSTDGAACGTDKLQVEPAMASPCCSPKASCC